ncbi:MAG: hypothetical protein QXK80_00940 [Candidatus Pacearchaeota archaeon]
MVEYQCEACGYRFYRERLPFRCPYCGKESSIRPSPSAEEIMNEIEKEEATK